MISSYCEVALGINIFNFTLKGYKSAKWVNSLFCGFDFIWFDSILGHLDQPGEEKK